MTKTTYPSDKQDKFMLRMPEGMRDRIKNEADSAKRSMNAEIVARLENSFSSAVPEPPMELMSAGEALAELQGSKEDLKTKVYELTVREINTAIKTGRPTAIVWLTKVPDLVDPDTSLTSGDEVFETIVRPTIDKLRDAGYDVNTSTPDAIEIKIEKAETQASRVCNRLVSYLSKNFSYKTELAYEDSGRIFAQKPKFNIRIRWRSISDNIVLFALGFKEDYERNALSFLDWFCTVLLDHGDNALYFESPDTRVLALLHILGFEQIDQFLWAARVEDLQECIGKLSPGTLGLDDLPLDTTDAEAIELGIAKRKELIDG